jgi:hypothetical protein
MYVCAAAYGAYMVYRNVAVPKQVLGIVLFVPAFASILFLLVAMVFPNLLAPKRLVFPLNVTLPPVYGALVLLTVMLFTSTGNSLVVPYDKLRAATFWANPWVLVLVTLGQILCLTFASLFSKEPAE